MNADPFRVVRDFEAALCAYTGAPYSVSVNSCSMAILLAVAWYREQLLKDWTVHKITPHFFLPSRTYPSVAMSIRHAGGSVEFTEEDWTGAYALGNAGADIWDCACRFTGGMYVPRQVQCVSFHARKLLKIGHGGAILHDNTEADAWYRKARFDGRTEGVPTAQDRFEMLGWHCYLTPDAAARGLHLLSVYPKDMPDMPKDEYPDLSRWPIFQTT